MRKFLVKVNGISYDVEIEEANGSFEANQNSTVNHETSNVQAQPVQVENKKPVATPKAQVASGEKIVAPMPGTIVGINVTQGQNVKSGDVLLILEAMKMENEIVAPRDGKVVQVIVAKGASVNTADVLVVLE